MAERDARQDILQDAEFVRRVFCYLENRISADDLKVLRAQLLNDPLKQDAFIELSMTRRGVIEVIRSRSESSSLVDSHTAHELSETMVVPAITSADFEPEEEILPGPTLLPASQQSSGKSVWQQNWFRAAAIVLPLLAGFVIWRSLTAGKQPTNNISVLVHPQPDPATQPAPPEPLVDAHAAVNPPLPVIPPPQPQARITQSLHARWDQTSDFPAGSKLTDGPHSLESGLVQITLSGGASVVLQAPVRFEVTSETELKIISGQLSAVVPHGSQGLRIQSPDLLVTDLGTEFGLNVISHKQTHVEVFQGQVRVDLPATQGVTSAVTSKIFGTNQAGVVKAGSSTIDVDAAVPLSFVRSNEIQQLAATGDQAMQRWTAFSDALRHDPELIAYYTFEPQRNDPTHLPNESVAQHGKYDGQLGASDGVGLLPQWSQGRWPHKGALKFGDRSCSSVFIPGDPSLVPGSPMSIAFWIKRSELKLPVHLINQGINGIGTFNISLMGTAGKPSLGLQPQSVYFNFGKGTEIAAHHVLPDDNQWLMVAIVVGSDRSARFYINGKFVGQGPMSVPTHANQSGDLYIGRVSPANAEADNGDFFRGWMDELAIFRRSLSDPEIQRMYDAGNTE